ncbi:hypothetical protein RSSM_06782 [Rhodopirellula sallentina SM41]|uniref:Uncharacterized protein n=1 Tax=Rhodopirellula sallentina SM41 TaxID=1263870 RepID=M5TRV9_9BACT|nr:hypothetical protein RSSM_06782 [Rhodopirellula sallentina SM41]
MQKDVIESDAEVANFVVKHGGDAISEGDLSGRRAIMTRNRSLL